LVHDSETFGVLLMPNFTAIGHEVASAGRYTTNLTKLFDFTYHSWVDLVYENESLDAVSCQILG